MGTECEDKLPYIKALEFFCGIGGLHYGFEWSGVGGEIIAAFDINPVAKECYRHNFGVDPIQVGIEHLDARKLQAYDANAWFLSPPCQPYTRKGKGRDDQDPRAKGLLHLIAQLPLLSEPPKFIFLENVLNFEKSETRNLLVKTLGGLGYEFEEWLLTPMQIGIPNDRVRYYLTVIRTGKVQEEALPPKLQTEWPYTLLSAPRCLGDFLEGDDDGHLAEIYKVPESFVRKRQSFSEFAVVTPDRTRTSCFTKAYGHHGLGTGSYLQTRGFAESQRLDDPATAVERLGLRLFSPTEIARLHAFPIDNLSPKPTTDVGGRHRFSFPPGFTTIQKWRLLGNSMNVAIVGELMRNALFKST